ncbi:hypothetical protein [Streptococcus pluranimalium]|uniref:Uncharacterized protein n=1 Tax=Streptococcus pluranimalium TaxID=82348 RepID=A0A2L0D4X5_9STRE|nr:hypothetical protein [Streptococcus pluranimalium]AUW96700.1 hypothetical protein C0J00_06035 [Streptococcus pluranimalium]
MKKRRILLISLFVLLGMIIFNFWLNSTYYAIHSKYTSQDEVPGIIVDHLDDVMYDTKYEHFGNYFLQTDGSKSISYNITTNVIGRSFGQESLGYYYLKEEKNKEFKYYFDESMSMIESDVSIDDGPYRSYQLTSKEEAKIRKELNELIKPLLKRVTKPFINLQWLYDFIFREH